VVAAKAIKRGKLLEFFASLPFCRVGLEACGSARYWARELIRLGHQARIMPPAYVKPYVRRQKNDAADAAAICEAVARPSMRLVAVRPVENQAERMRHKAREMLVSQRTQLLNALRGPLGEGGVIAARGPRHAREPRKPHTDALRMGAKRLIEAKPFKRVAAALANKLARIVFALLKTGKSDQGVAV
jgi:transposase